MDNVNQTCSTILKEGYLKSLDITIPSKDGKDAIGKCRHRETPQLWGQVGALENGLKFAPCK